MGTDGVSEGTFAIDVDEDGIVRVVLPGVWSMETVARYSAAIRETHEQCRRTRGWVREVIDARDMPIQSQDVAAGLAGAPRFQPGDRVAIIVATVLAKIATRGHMGRQQADERLPDVCARELFASPTEAEAWIRA